MRWAAFCGAVKQIQAKVAGLGFKFQRVKSGFSRIQLP